MSSTMRIALAVVYIRRTISSALLRPTLVADNSALLRDLPYRSGEPHIPHRRKPSRVLRASYVGSDDVSDRDDMNPASNSAGKAQSL
jgi:hypothetical protein